MKAVLSCFSCCCFQNKYASRIIQLSITVLNLASLCYQNSTTETQDRCYWFLVVRGCYDSVMKTKTNIFLFAFHFVGTRTEHVQSESKILAPKQNCKTFILGYKSRDQIRIHKIYQRNTYSKFLVIIFLKLTQVSQ